jgi:hypothetical protein
VLLFRAPFLNPTGLAGEPTRLVAQFAMRERDRLNGAAATVDVDLSQEVHPAMPPRQADYLARRTFVISADALLLDQRQRCARG